MGQVRRACGGHDRFVLRGIFIRLEQNAVELLGNGRWAGALGEVLGPSVDFGLDTLFFLDRGERLRNHFGRGFAKAALAGAAKVMRRFVQAQQGRHLFSQTGLGVEILLGQIQEPELFLWREFPRQGEINPLTERAGLPQQCGGIGLAKLEQDMAGLDLHALATLELDLARGLGLGQDPTRLEFPSVFKQCKHGQIVPRGCAFSARGGYGLRASGDNRAMAIVLQKPHLLVRLRPLVKGFDGPLAFAIFVLACLGLVTMYSSGFANGARFFDHGRNMLIAGFIMFVVAQIPPQRLMALAVPLYTLGVALLVAVALFGLTKKGARRWLNIGVVIQPSEIMKIAMPLMLAWWFQKREGQLRTLDFIVAGLLLLVPVGLIVKQPDLGTAILVLSAGLAVIFFAGMSWWLIIPPIVLGLVGVVLLILFEPSLCADGVRWPVLHDYQQQRVCTLLDPTRDPLGRGFHIIQGMIAIGSGGFWGKGFMQGTQTHLDFIPERTTDFVFAAYCEEFGFVGVLVLIAAFLFLIMRGLTIAVEGPTLFTRLLAGSITLSLFIYVFVNMGMVTGILPVVGVPLPFISYGGTAMVTLGLGLGILMSVAKSKQLVQS